MIKNKTYRILLPTILFIIGCYFVMCLNRDDFNDKKDNENAVVSFFHKRNILQHDSVTTNEPDFSDPIHEKTFNVIMDYNNVDYYVHRGGIYGFNYELLSLIANELGIKYRIESRDNRLDSISRMISDKHQDYDIATINITEEHILNNDSVHFSNSLFDTKKVLVQNKNNELIKDINNLDSIDICIIKGSNSESILRYYIDSLKKHINIVSLPYPISSEDILLSINKNNIKYAALDYHIVNSISHTMTNLDFSLVLKDSIPIKWMLNPANKELNDTINYCIDKYKKNGIINTLYRRYYKSKHVQKHHYSIYRHRSEQNISDYDSILKEESKILNWDWKLLAAIICNESNFQADIVSENGAYGLMQVIEPTAEAYHVSDYIRPDSNIYVGVRYLQYISNFFDKYELDEKEKIKFILASYNGGVGHVLDAIRLCEKYGDNPKIWDKNVEKYILKKSDSKYYLDDIVRNGYCDGQQIFNYVNKVMQTYHHYCNIDK